jgi:ubiquinone/menaquinone biosynthesis C-methylase UbiE
MNVLSEAPVASSDWWRDFFDPVVGDVLFADKMEHAGTEVEHIIRRTNAKPPAEVLDLACGVGRHSLVFAAHGFTVTGLDYSQPFLRAARRRARDAGLKIRFVQGDMKDLGSHFADDRFDLIVSLFNSFGYFERRRDNTTTLRAVHRVLRPGGAFVINTLNAAGVARRLKQPVAFRYEPLPNVQVTDASRYDARRKKTYADWTIVDARRPKARVFRRSVCQHVYSHAELTRLLTATGFRIGEIWSSWAGDRFDAAKSWDQTIVARKPAGVGRM